MFALPRNADGVAIWSQALFNDPATHNLRLFLSRVFSLREISVVEIDRRAGVGRLKYELSKDAPSFWRKLKQVLTQRTAVDLDDEVRSEYGAAPSGSRSALPGYAGDFTDSHRPRSVRICRPGICVIRRRTGCV